MVLQYPTVPSHPATHARWQREGAYSTASFAIEPIQLPIVPLSLFWLQRLHTTEARKRAASTGPANGCAAAAQSGAQMLEVRELAELRRQRAVQLIRLQSPAAARVAARYPVVSKLRAPNCSTRYRSTP